jgi:hypothetical protein
VLLAIPFLSMSVWAVFQCIAANQGYYGTIIAGDDTNNKQTIANVASAIEWRTVFQNAFIAW